MRRRIITLGKKSYSITLPIEWVKKYNISKEVEVQEKEGVLEIKPIGSEIKERRLKEIDLRNIPDFLAVRIIGACYKAGYDDLIIKLKQNQIKKIKEIAKELLGYEIMEINENICKIKRIGFSRLEDFKIAEKKCWHILLDMLEDCLKGLKENNKKLLNDVINSDSFIDKFSDYAMHIIIKYKGSNIKNSYINFLFLYQLEKISDNLVEIAKIGINNKIKNEKLFRIHNKIIEIVREFYNVYYKFNIEKTKKIVSLLEKTKKFILSTSQLKNKTEIMYFNYLNLINNSLSWLVTPLLIKNL